MSSYAPPMLLRTCRRCGEARALTQFNAQRSGPAGRSAICRVCANAARRERPRPTRSPTPGAAVAAARRGRGDEGERLLVDGRPPPEALLPLAVERHDDGAPRLVQALVAAGAARIAPDRHGDRIATSVVAARHGNAGLARLLIGDDAVERLMVASA